MKKLDVRAVTAVAGNVPLERTYKNAVCICHYFGQKLRIGSGVVKPLARELETGEMVHSPSGLGGVTIPEEVAMPKKENAIEVIQSVLEEAEEKVTLIPIGPLTNIALFVSQSPELKDKVKEIVIMGGAFKGPAIHDMVPVAYAIDPTVCSGKAYQVDVECRGELTYGRRVVDFGDLNENKNVKVLFESDHERIIAMFKKSIDQLDQV
jgi:inosine-uridine nucleoside N-ribohydrolase